MLVLTRKMGEKFYVGEDICVTLVEIDRGKVRIGIEAPADVPIYREEIMTIEQREARRAAIEANRAKGYNRTT